MNNLFNTALLMLTVLATGTPSAQSNGDLASRTQRNHALYADYDHGRSLKEQSVSENKDVHKIIQVYETAAVCTTCTPAPASDNPAIKSATKESNLVAIGHIVSQRASLTDNEAFIFTDSELVIDEVWHAKSAGACHISGCQITVTTPGGITPIGSHKAEVHFSNRRELGTGRKYLLFLRYIPATDSYQPVDLVGFQIGRVGIVPLVSSLPSPNAELLSEPDTFLLSIRSSVRRAEAEE